MISYEEAGKILLSRAVKLSEFFLEEGLPEIAKDLNVDLDDFDCDILRTETLFVSLWATIKALEGDKRGLVDAIHKAFFSLFEDDKSDKLKEIYRLRNKRYNDAWDDSPGGNQSILCINILAEMFYKGELNRNLLAFFAFVSLNFFVLKVMESVLDLRKEIKLLE